MEKDSRNTMIMILIVFVVLLIALVAIVISTYQVVQRTGGIFPPEEDRIQIPFVLTNPPPSPEQVVVQGQTSEYDYLLTPRPENAYYLMEENDALSYNFSIDDNINSIANAPSGVKDEGLVEEVRDRQEDLEDIDFGDLETVEIPSVGIESDIFQGLNGDELLDRGWWLYPASYVNEPGEKILYCHRRFFGRDDSRTCWNMDKVLLGDQIIITNTDQEEFRYEVISSSVVHETVTNLMKPSRRDYVKIVTCGTETGAAGGDDWRVVVVAELIE